MISILLLTTILTVNAISHLTITDYSLSSFELYKQHYNKVYSNVDEEEMRYSYFVSNMQDAFRRNAIETNAVFGATIFTDYSLEEHYIHLPIYLTFFFSKKRRYVSLKRLKLGKTKFLY